MNPDETTKPVIEPPHDPLDQSTLSASQPSEDTAPSPEAVAQAPAETSADQAGSQPTQTGATAPSDSASKPVTAAPDAGASTTSQQTASAQPEPLSGQNQDVSQKLADHKRQLKKLLIGAVLGLCVLIGLAIAASIVLSGGALGKLVVDSRDGMTFQRPEKWVLRDSEQDYTIYTEEGLDLDNENTTINRGIMVGKQTMGVDFATLSDDEKSQIRQSFEGQFSTIGASLAKDSCDEVGDVTTGEDSREGYSFAYMAEAQCTKLSDQETGGTIKMMFGWAGSELHIFAVAADDATWQSDGAKLNEVFESVRPL